MLWSDSAKANVGAGCTKARGDQKRRVPVTLMSVGIERGGVSVGHAGG